jgi:hypothetical protein
MTELPTPLFPQLYILCMVHTLKQFTMATTITRFCSYELHALEKKNLYVYNNNNNKLKNKNSYN